MIRAVFEKLLNLVQSNLTRLKVRSYSILDHMVSSKLLGKFVSPNFRAKISRVSHRKTIDSLDNLYAFWKQKKPEGNFFNPQSLSPRSETIITMLKSRITTDTKILEVGCNVGRNLNHLHKKGYEQLAGIEISHHAVKRLRQAYPDLDSVKIDIGPAENILSLYGTGLFDVVFTMAVIEHIHPSSKILFSEIARVALQYVLTIEPRNAHSSHRQYPWDVVKEFENVGLKLISKKVWSSLWTTTLNKENHWSKDFDNYDALLFEVQKN